MFLYSRRISKVHSPLSPGVLDRLLWSQNRVTCCGFHVTKVTQDYIDLNGKKTFQGLVILPRSQSSENRLRIHHDPEAEN